MIRTCERFHCLPSQLYKEDASFLRMIHIYDIGNPPREEEIPDYG